VIAPARLKGKPPCRKPFANRRRQALIHLQVRIAAAWRQQVASIFETGRLLIEAKAKLGHGAWGAMFTATIDCRSDKKQRDVSWRLRATRS
jgi:hypothetical protein